MKTVFFGTPRLAQIVLEKLISSPFKPNLVITASDKKAGRGHQNQESPVKKTALKNKINVLQPEKLDKVNFEFDLAILVAYGSIIPTDILSIPKYGFLNIHPSLLPKYRGPSPIIQSILNGDKKTGVTIIKLDEELDHGPILAQKDLTLTGNETHQSLMEKLAILGSDLLIDILPPYLKGSLKPKEQKHSQTTYTKKITKADGAINLLNPPNHQALNRMIRAFYPWPGVYAKLKIKSSPRFASLDSESERASEAGEKLKVIKFLPGQPFLIQPEGKRPLSLQQFKNGYPQLYSQIKPILERKQS